VPVDEPTQTLKTAWMARLVRSRSALPPEDEVTAPEGLLSPPKPLHERAPFNIGFFFAFGAMCAYGMIYALIGLRDIVMLVLLALAIALGLNRGVEFLRRRGLPRGLSVVFVIVVVLAVIALAMVALVPMVVQQIDNLRTSSPMILQTLYDNPQIAALDEQFHFLSAFTDWLLNGDWLSGLAGGIVGAGFAVANAVFSLIITLVLTVYFLVTLPAFKETIYRLAPKSRRKRAKAITSEIFDRVGGYISGLATLMLIAACVAFVYLSVIGLFQYALALAVVVAICWLIPIVGPLIAVIVLTVVAFASTNWIIGLVTLGFWLLYTQFDAYFTNPRIMGQAVNVPGILIILGAISCGALMGVMGAILAVPIMAVVMLLIREVLLPALERR
jgi:predicted PurR-regulated permease PerM